jgi:uncharacterized protein YdaT
MAVIKINGVVDTEGTAIGYINDSQTSFTLRQRRERAQYNQDMENGNQWSAEEAAIYSSKGTDPVTVNECRPAVKGLVGMQLQDQQEIRVRPRKNSTESSARVYTELLKHTQDVANAGYKYTQLFHQGTSDPEAFIAVHNDKRANANGQPRLKVYGQSDVDADPSSETYNLSGDNDENEGAAFVILKDWVPIDWLEKAYPDKITDIGGTISVDPSVEDNVDSQVARIAEWHFSGGSSPIDDDEFGNDEDDKQIRDKYRYRVHTVYWREYVESVFVTDQQSGVTKQFTDEKNIRRFTLLGRKGGRFTVETAVGRRLHRTVVLGNQMELESTPNPFGEQISDYPVFRFSSFWKDGTASAFLDDIVSLNREKNIHRTQTIQVLNSMANNGFMVKGGSDADQQELANYGSVSGYIIDESKFGDKVTKIEPNTLPTGHFTMDQTFSGDIERVSGIDETTKGIADDKNQSGRAKFLQDTSNKRSSGMIIAHNFYHTLELLGSFLLDMIRQNDIYTPAEIRQVVSESTLIDKGLQDKARKSLQDRTGADLPEPTQLPPITPEMVQSVRPEDQADFLETVQSGTEAATQYLKDYPRLLENFEEVVKEEAIDMLMAELKEDGIAEYGVKVTLSPSSDTSRSKTAADLQALREAGVFVPPEVLIDATDLQPSVKEELKAGIQRAMQAQAGQQAAPPQRVGAA